MNTTVNGNPRLYIVMAYNAHPDPTDPMVKTRNVYGYWTGAVIATHKQFALPYTTQQAALSKATFLNESSLGKHWQFFAWSL